MQPQRREADFALPARLRPSLLYGIKAVPTRNLSVPKIRFYNNGDEVRRGPAPMRCGLRAGWRDGSERLCQETDESSTRYNKRHTSSGSGVSALRPRRQYGRHTRDESIRSIFRRSRSAKASLGQWACHGCSAQSARDGSRLPHARTLISQRELTSSVLP